MSQQNLSSFVSSVADFLRGDFLRGDFLCGDFLCGDFLCGDFLCGDFKHSELGKVILPFPVLPRLDCVREAKGANVLKEKEQRENMGVNLDPFLLRQSGQHLYNTSPLNIKKAWAIEMTLPRTCNDTFGHFRRHYVTSLNALIFTPKPTDAVTKAIAKRIAEAAK